MSSSPVSLLDTWQQEGGSRTKARTGKGGGTTSVLILRPHVRTQAASAPCWQYDWQGDKKPGGEGREGANDTVCYDDGGESYETLRPRIPTCPYGNAMLIMAINPGCGTRYEQQNAELFTSVG